MDTTRQLPEDRNPLLDVERAPQYEILVERRCLGQTELKVKPGQIGTSNATKKENLGVLDYAHLRAPLPKDLTGSGIFAKGSNRKYPEAYFLMAAFPYAQVDEENAEKEYIKSLQAASSEEVAGNVWIQPDEALSLADEYGIRYWIEALLDPEPITHGTNDTAKAIQSPPPFRAREMEAEGVNGVDKTPEKKFDGRRSTRRGGSVSVRSESPTKESKIKTPARKIATPRTKRGRGRPALGSVDEGGISLESESINGDAHKHEETSSRPTSRRETVKIEVETTTTELPGDDEEVEHTKVNIEMPTGHPDLELPNDAEAMLEKARQMVREANKMEAEGVNGVDKTPEKKFDGRRSTRRGGSVSVRSESPTKESKIKTPARKIATPRTKRGRGRPALGSVDEGGISLESESINGDAHKHEETSSRPTSRRETVKIEVETTTTELPGDDEEVEHTKVNIEMPTGHPDLELPNDAEAMLEKARQMVREANSISGPSTTSKVSKRKAEEMVEADDEVGLEGPASRANKTRKMEVELRKERIRRRAMAGIAATLFIGPQPFQSPCKSVLTRLPFPPPFPNFPNSPMFSSIFCRIPPLCFWGIFVAPKDTTFTCYSEFIRLTCPTSSRTPFVVKGPCKIDTCQMQNIEVARRRIRDWKRRLEVERLLKRCYRLCSGRTVVANRRCVLPEGDRKPWECVGRTFAPTPRQTMIVVLTVLKSCGGVHNAILCEAGNVVRHNV
nr:hypothetical protein CFP56_11842 [Quercus suber]